MNHLFFVGALQVDDLQNIHKVLDQFRLSNISGNAVKDQDVFMRLVTRKRLVGVQSFRPDLHGQFIRHQLTLRAVLVDLATVFAADIDRTKHIANREMEKAWHRTQDRSLCTLSHARGPKQEN